MGVTHATTAGVHRQRPTRSGITLGDERASFAVVDKAEALEPEYWIVGKGVVDHEVVHIGVGDLRCVEGRVTRRANELGPERITHACWAGDPRFQATT